MYSTPRQQATEHICACVECILQANSRKQSQQIYHCKSAVSPTVSVPVSVWECDPCLTCSGSAHMSGELQQAKVLMSKASGNVGFASWKFQMSGNFRSSNNAVVPKRRAARVFAMIAESSSIFSPFSVSISPPTRPKKNNRTSAA